MIIRRFFSLILPVEWVILGYILISGLFTVIFSNRLSGELSHLLFRVLVLILILLFALTSRKFNSLKYFNLVRLFFPVLLLAYLYKETDYLNNIFFQTDLDPLIAVLDEYIFGMQPALIFASALPYGFFAELMYFGYFSYYLMILTVPSYLYVKVSRQSGEQMFFIIINSFVIFYIVFIVLPVAGPQFYFKDDAGIIPEGYLFGPIMDVLQHIGEGKTAAFPSSHVSICIMLIYGCLKHARNLLKIFIPLGLLLIMSTVYIKAHYVVDILSAVLYTPGLFIFSRRLYHWLSDYKQNQELKWQQRL